MHGACAECAEACDHKRGPCVQTLGVDLMVKSVMIPDTNTMVELFMFYCAGQLIFNQLEMGTQYVRANTQRMCRQQSLILGMLCLWVPLVVLTQWENASAFMIVFDLGNRESFLAAGKWLQSMQQTQKWTNAITSKELTTQ